MAIFNAPIDLDMHEDRAILAAIEIKKEMQKADLGIAIGIGINSGNAVIGNMGSDTRFDFTAIGSDVNLAARCESSCKEVGKDIVIASNTATQTDIKLMKLKPIAMKGIAKPVEIYTVQEST
jgi:adenylate cyclase